MRKGKSLQDFLNSSTLKEEDLVRCACEKAKIPYIEDAERREEFFAENPDLLWWEL